MAGELHSGRVPLWYELQNEKARRWRELNNRNTTLTFAIE